MRKPKIAQVVCTYPPYRGGMGGVAFEYTERLRERGYNVHVFTAKQSGVTEDPSYVHRIPSILSIGNGSVMPSLYKRLSGFDLIHLHYPFFGGAEPTIVRKAVRHNQGLVMTYHMDAIAGGLRGAMFSAHRRVLFPWLVNRVDRVLVSSMDYAETSALTEVKGAMDRTEVHPFGVDLKRFSPGRSLIRDAFVPDGETPLLLFVGGLDAAHHFKGVAVMLAALRKLTELPWELVIVGDGDLREGYEKKAEEYGLGSRVHFAGNVSNEELPDYYRAADIHLFPSTRRAEAFGIVALEAAASGTPTIASSLPGVRTVVQDGATGLLVAPDDVLALRKAIELLVTQRELRTRLGQAARLHAESTFAWDPIMDALEHTYESVLSQQASRTYEQGDV